MNQRCEIEYRIISVVDLKFRRCVWSCMCISPTFKKGEKAHKNIRKLTKF